LQIRRRDNGDYVFAEDPSIPSSAARLFWRHEVDPMTIRASARACAPEDPDAFDLRRLGLPIRVFRAGGEEEVAIAAGPTIVRISVAGGTLLDGPVRMSYRVEGRQPLSRRLLALQQFDALMRLRRIPRPLQVALPARSSERMTLLLRTLDALAASKRTRIVAIALFGAERVEADWTHESDYLRMKTRRLIDAAKRLVKGGYLTLLR